jgi:UTP--glucose-1-phosphate uridylyltransferase
MPAGHATWMFQKVKTQYADETMELCWFNVKANDEASLKGGEETAESCYKKTAVAAPAGTTLAKDVLYKIVFNQDSFASSYYLDPPPAGETTNAAFFLQHFPSEFEDRVHWLQDINGTDIEYGAALPPPKANPNLKGLAYVASFIVVLVSFAGVLLSAKCIVDLFGGPKRFRNSAGAFASGALLFCAFSLLLPEALHLIGSSSRKPAPYTESEVSAIYAFSFTIGVVFCIGVDIVCHRVVNANYSKNAGKGAPDGETAETKPTSNAIVPKDKSSTDEVDVEEGKRDDAPSAAKDQGASARDSTVAVADYPPSSTSICDCSFIQPVAYEIIIGDFFHNLVDGIVIGAAFMTCDGSGWVVTAGTIYHEITQEVADFLVLISEGRMTFVQAALGNFVSALGVIIGCIIVTEMEPDMPTKGGLMAFGASFYVYVALSQLRWWVEKEDLLRNFFLFSLGCLGIGLVLISHEHCVPVGEGAHAH